jgi:hypothetical protein
MASAHPLTKPLVGQNGTFMCLPERENDGWMVWFWTMKLATYAFGDFGRELGACVHHALSGIVRAVDDECDW